TVIRDTRAHSATGRRMPPMLDVSGAELAGSGSQKMLPRNFATNGSEGHDILKLIAKTVGTAQLIKSRPGPNAAGEGLIEKPTIDHQIRGSNGCRDLYSIEDIVPTRRNFEQGFIQIFCPILAEQSSCLFFVFGLPKK